MGGISSSEAAAIAEERVKIAVENEREKIKAMLEGSDDENEFLPLVYQSHAIPRAKWKRGGVLGSGAFSQVYSGTLEQKGQPIPVAIKSVPLNILQDMVTQDSKAFLTELDAAKQIQAQGIEQSPGMTRVIGIFGISLHRKRLGGKSTGSLLLERGECTLEDLLNKNSGQSLSIEEKLGFALDIVSGLDAIHNVDVIHRDLKDSNIIMVKQPNGRLVAKVADFGVSHAKQLIAARTTRRSHLDEKVGTELWQAPELLLNGDAHSKRSDIYAFGLICWRILSGGEPLFIQGTKKEVKEKKRLSVDLNVTRYLYEKNNKIGMPKACMNEPNPFELAMWNIIERCLQKTRSHSDDTESDQDFIDVHGSHDRPTANELVIEFESLLTKVESMMRDKKTDVKNTHQAMSGLTV